MRTSASRVARGRMLPRRSSCTPMCGACCSRCARSPTRRARSAMRPARRSNARIAQIYEGTNGIQAIDLVTRKIPMMGGAVMHGYLDELRRTVASVKATNDPAFGAAGARLGEAVESLDRATTWLIGKLDKSPDAALAGAAPYLRLFAFAAGGCMLAENALAESRGGIDGGGRVALARFF